MQSEFPTLTKTEHISIFLLFTILAAIYSFPLLVDISSSGSGDGALQPHGFWWIKKALGSFKNPYYTDYYFFPQGANLAFGMGMLTEVFLTLPVSILFGVNQAVNISFFLGYLLSGYFVFLLAHDLTGDKRAAVIGGITFAFIPYHFSHVPLQSIISNAEWIPFYLLMLNRALESSNKKWALFAGLAMALIILSDQLQSIFAVMITAAIVPFFLIRTKNVDGKTRIRLHNDLSGVCVRLLIIVLVSALASSIYLWPAFDFLIKHRESIKIGIFEHGGANLFSADLLGFIVPPSYNPIWGGALKPIGNSFFLGYMPVFLAALSVFFLFRHKTVRFLSGMITVTFILSLGVTLHLNGTWQWDGAFYKLPYFYLSDFPPFSYIRCPYRFHLLTTLALALLASFGAHYLLSSGKLNKRANVVCIIISAIILLEFLPGFVEYSKAGPVPKIYHEIAKDKEPYTILELPLSRWSSLLKNGSGSPAWMLYYQSVHQKKIFNGFASRTAVESMLFYNPILEILTDISADENYNIIGHEHRNANWFEMNSARELAMTLTTGSDDFLKQFNIRYIILHAPISYAGSISRTFIETYVGRPMLDSMEDGLAYIKVR